MKVSELVSDLLKQDQNARIFVLRNGTRGDPIDALLASQDHPLVYVVPASEMHHFMTNSDQNPKEKNSL